MDSAEVPDLTDQRARRAVRQWLQEDGESRALLAELEDDPIGGEMALKERLERAAPAEVKSFLRMSGGNVEKLVNVAKAEQLHIHQSPFTQRPLVRLFLKPLSTKIHVGAAEPCVVVARVENHDTVHRTVELRVTGWFSEFSEIEGGERQVVPAGGYLDTRINVGIAPGVAASLPAGEHALEVQVAVQAAEGPIAWAERGVGLDVLPFPRVHVELHPTVWRCRDWRRQWAQYQLVIQNRGNEPAEVEINADFDDASLVVETHDGSVHLALGSQRELAVRVRPLQDNFSLRERAHPFRLDISTHRHDQDEVSGTVWQPPFFTPARNAIIAVVVLALAFLFLPFPSSSPTSSEEPAAGATTKTAARSATSRTPEPAAVVKAFYDAVNRGDYGAAWVLLGPAKLGMTRTDLEHGFARTDHVAVEVRKAGATTVTVRLIADENDYRRTSVYEVTYTVRDGLIVSSTHQKTIG